MPRVDDVFVPLFGVVSVATALLLAYGGSGHALTYVAVTPSTSAAGPNVVHVGASPPVSFTVRQPSLPLTHRLVDARGMAVTSVTRNASAVSVAGTLTPPATTGPTRVRVFVTPYPAVLPRWLLARLQGVHPLAAAATSTGTVLGPVWLCYRALLDPRAPLRASRSRWERLLREGFR